MKACLILYDQLWFQDGTYYIVADQEGQGLHFVNAPMHYEERIKFQFCNEPGEFYLAANDNVVMRLPSACSYTVDYYPILHRADLVNATCIRSLAGDLDDRAKATIERNPLVQDLHNACPDVFADYPFIRQHVIRGMIHDSVLASYLKMPFSVDGEVTKLIERQQQIGKSALQHELQPYLVDSWVEMRLPNFSEWQWDDVLTFRESESGVSFRRMVQRVCTRAKEAIDHTADERDIKLVISRELSAEAIEELMSFVPSLGETMLSMGLNFMAFGLVPSLLKDGMEYARATESWIAILKRRPRIN